MFQAIEARIRRLLDSTGTPSVAVAVGRQGKILWEAGFGYADLANKVPATAATLYSLASISKPITATGLMTLVERGKVNLDRPVNDYLRTGQITGLAGPASEATVRRVMSHTAGLPLHARFFYQGGADPRPTKKEAIDRYVVTYLFLYPEPDVATVVLANDGETDLPMKISFALAGLLIPGFDPAAAEQKVMARFSAEPKFNPPAGLLGEWSGTVRTY